MSKKGLLSKAIDMTADETDSRDDESDLDSGITSEDRKEIRAQIEEISRKNRIEVTPERFSFSPIKKGFVFPLMVNLLALGCTAGALWGLSRVFTAQEAEIHQTGAALSSAEGKLIQELKRDAESRLGEKDKEIADVQARLAAMEIDHNALQRSFDEKLATKESELKAEMQRELDKERERLRAEGYSEEIIQERLKQYEEERMSAFNRELEAYKQQLVKEKAAAEVNYTRLQNQYNTNLATLNDERKRIQAESQQREDQLRASLEAKTRELESKSQAAATQAALSATEAAKATAGLAQAQTELAKLAEQRKASTAAEDRVIGLYLSVRTALDQGDYEAATNRAVALRTYVTDPTIANLPALQGRREADLFAADALGRLARYQLEQASVDNSVLLDQSELMLAIRSRIADADAAVKAGNADAAEAAYNDAIAKIPDVLTAHKFLMDRQAARNAARRDAAVEAMARAKAAQDASDFPTAAAAYGETASLLGLGEADSATLVSGVSALALARNGAENAAADTRAAAPVMTRAKREFDAERWTQAANIYAGVLRSYPKANQAADALKGIEASLSSLAKLQGGAADATAARVRELEAQTAKLTEDLRQSTDNLAAAQAKATELQASLDALRQSGAQPTGTATASTGQNAQVASLERQIADLKAQNQRFADAANRYDSLVGAYSRYRTAEDAAFAKGGASSVVEARTQLDAFLSATDTRAAFPDLKERIARYEKEYVAAGQKESLYNAMTIAESALRMRDAAARDKYFADTAARYADDQYMTEFIAALKRGLR